MIGPRWCRISAGFFRFLRDVGDKQSKNRLILLQAKGTQPAAPGGVLPKTRPAVKNGGCLPTVLSHFDW